MLSVLEVHLLQHHLRCGHKKYGAIEHARLSTNNQHTTPHATVTCTIMYTCRRTGQGSLDHFSVN